MSYRCFPFSMERRIKSTNSYRGNTSTLERCVSRMCQIMELSIGSCDFRENEHAPKRKRSSQNLRRSIKGKTFLDDQFSLTEFGRMVLQNGTIRAGRAKNAKQIVVARETLYCSGSGACKRACGYYGECMPGCDKTKMRGHKCSYRVKLTMRLGYVNYWFVEVLGSHDQFAVTNYSLNQRIVNSPLSKSNSSSLSSSSSASNRADSIVLSVSSCTAKP